MDPAHLEMDRALAGQEVPQVSQFLQCLCQAPRALQDSRLFEPGQRVATIHFDRVLPRARSLSASLYMQSPQQRKEAMQTAVGAEAVNTSCGPGERWP